jgi:hypothetical protein
MNTTALAKKLVVEERIAKGVAALQQADPSLSELDAVLKLFRANYELYEAYRETSSIRSASA